MYWAPAVSGQLCWTLSEGHSFSKDTPRSFPRELRSRELQLSFISVLLSLSSSLLSSFPLRLPSGPAFSDAPCRGLPVREVMEDEAKKQASLVEVSEADLKELLKDFQARNEEIKLTS